MEAEKKNANTMKGVKTFALAGVIVGLLMALGMIVGGVNIFGATPGFGGVITGLGIVALVVLPIVFAILVVLSTLIVSAIIHVIAKILGGQGTFAEFYYLYSRLAIPTIIIGLLFFVLGLIPIVGLIVGLISFIWNLYMIWVFIILVSVAYNVSKVKAFIILLVPAIIMFILFVVVIGAAILSLVGGAAAGAAAGTIQ